MIELHNGELYYHPTKIIYKNKEFTSPVNINTLLSWDYIYTILKNKQL
jgi:hypothetical protein